MSHAIQLEHYLDSLESLPAELRRNFTLLRDLDERSQGLSRTVESEAEEYTKVVAQLAPAERRRHLHQLDRLHVKLRALADDKVQLAIQTYELVDKHIRRLDSDLAGFELELKQKGINKRGQPLEETGKKARKKSDAASNKRHRSDDESDSAQAQKRKGKKAFEEKTAQLSITNPSDILDMPVDPNEPTYCLCHQVSYGEMIGCDNQDCQVEWFHFACVGLSTKPKGKWFCPKCGGDRKKK